MRLVVLSTTKSFEVNCLIQTANKMGVKAQLIKYQNISLNSKIKSAQISQKIAEADFIINKASEDPHLLPLQIRENLISPFSGVFSSKELGIYKHQADSYKKFPS